jgi:hypothetical protein
MRKTALKLGFSALLAVVTMLAAKPTHAAGRLCIYSFTNQSGATCTYAGIQGNCCVYTAPDGSHCDKICNPPA